MGMVDVPSQCRGITYEQVAVIRRNWMAPSVTAIEPVVIAARSNLADTFLKIC